MQVEATKVDCKVPIMEQSWQLVTRNVSERTLCTVVIKYVSRRTDSFELRLCTLLWTIGVEFWVISTNAFSLYYRNSFTFLLGRMEFSICQTILWHQCFLGDNYIIKINDIADEMRYKLSGHTQLYIDYHNLKETFYSFRNEISLIVSSLVIPSV